MKHKLKSYIYIVIALALSLLVFEIFTSFTYFSLFAVGLLIMSGSLFIKSSRLRHGFFFIGLAVALVSLFLTRSIWLVLITLVFFYFLYGSDDMNELFDQQETSIHSPFLKTTYQGMELVEPQSQQRTPLTRHSIFSEDFVSGRQHVWDDVNLVYFGGNNIIDFGNTVIPTGTTTVVIRKLFGRTRVIISKDIALKLNIVALRGSVYLNEKSYLLASENLRCEDEAYPDASRKINLIVSTCFGNVEVIRL